MSIWNDSTFAKVVPKKNSGKRFAITDPDFLKRYEAFERDVIPTLPKNKMMQRYHGFIQRAVFAFWKEHMKPAAPEVKQAAD